MRSLKLFLAAALAAGSHAYAAPGAPAPSLSYPFPGAADILVNSVMVPTRPTVGTYYETLGWNFGFEGAGYAGIQWTSETFGTAGGPVFIFSMWDPIATTAPITVEHRGPGVLDRPFGGEGTGRNTMNWTLGWQANTWYTTVVRRWDCHGSSTCVGFWALKQDDNRWTHNATLVYPVSRVFFSGGLIAFLEDFYQNGLYRSVQLKGAWARLADARWSGLGQAYFNASTENPTVAIMRDAYNGYTQGDSFVMEAGMGVAPRIRLGDLLPPATMPASPSFPVGRIQSMNASLSGDVISVQWTPDPASSPQFGYRVQIFRGAQTTAAAEVSETLPQARAALVRIPGADTYRVELTLVDLFDQRSAVASATVQPDPVANVGVSIVASSNPTATGKDLVLTVTATNQGPSLAHSVRTGLSLPSVAVTWMSPGCELFGNSALCGAGTLAAGASASHRVVIRPLATGTLALNVTVQADEIDPLNANNSSAISIGVTATPPGTPITRYRLYSPVTLEHHFTTDLNEYAVLAAQEGTWVAEGSAGKVLNNPGTFAAVNAVAYYRLYNTGTRWHHWTTDANEYYTLVGFPGWSGEGVDGYILPIWVPRATPLYRLLYPYVAGLHHWTIDANEYSALITNYGWVGEPGTGYVIQATPEQTSPIEGRWTSTATPVSVDFGGPPFCNYRVTMADLRLDVTVTAEGAVSNASITGTMVEVSLGNCTAPTFGSQANSWSMGAGSHTSGTSIELILPGSAGNRPASDASFSGSVVNGVLSGTITIRRIDQTGNLAWVIHAPLAAQ